MEECTLTHSWDLPKCCQTHLMRQQKKIEGDGRDQERLTLNKLNIPTLNLHSYLGAHPSPHSLGGSDPIITLVPTTTRWPSYHEGKEETCPSGQLRGCYFDLDRRGKRVCNIPLSDRSVTDGRCRLCEMTDSEVCNLYAYIAVTHITL
jgi:hypothetical protein